MVQETGKYEVSDAVKKQMDRLFYAGSCDDNNAEKQIKKLFEEYSYLCDPHTAVVMDVYEHYRKETGDNTKIIVASTASPYKFPQTVLKAIAGVLPEDEFAAAEELERCSNLPMPYSLKELRQKEIRFSGAHEKEEMENLIRTRFGGGT